MGFAHAGPFAQVTYGYRFVQMIGNILYHIGQAIVGAQLGCILGIVFTSVALQNADDQLLEHVIHEKVLGRVVFGK